MFGLGMQEILIILIFALLVFGAAKLPEIGKSLGKALREFKKGVQDSSEEGDKKDEEKK